MNKSDIIMSERISSEGHVSEEELRIFNQDRMTLKERRLFLEHVCSCNYCADQMVVMMEENLIQTPRDMKDNILRKTRRPEVQLPIKVKETSKGLQLFFYSLKVSTATIGALLLLVMTFHMDTNWNQINNTSGNNTGNISLTEAIRAGVDSFNTGMEKISSNMLEFSNNIINVEGIQNDQKEK